MKSCLSLCSLLVALCIAVPAQATIVGLEDFDGGDINLNSFTTSANVPIGGFNNPGDGFEVYTRLVSGSIPFNISDDSVTSGTGGAPFPGDVNGPLGNSKNNDGVFGITDTWNPDTNNSEEVTGTWSFDVSSATLPQLQVSIDMAAMEDYAGSTVNSNVDFFYQLDGSGYQPLFTSSIAFGNSQQATMDIGTVVGYFDPVVMTPFDRAGTGLTDEFKTISANILGSGTTLEIQVRVNMDGSESFVMDNITVRAVPEPSSLTWLAIAGLAIIGNRRRK